MNYLEPFGRIKRKKNLVKNRDKNIASLSSRSLEWLGFNDPLDAN